MKSIQNFSKQVLDNKVDKVPVSISARHVHINQESLEILFGKGHKLTLLKNLSQPGQYAAEEKVTIVGPKKQIQGVRVLGPCRKESQVELSMTDAWQLGIMAPVRNSGDLEDSAPIKLIGPCGSVELKQGCIIAQRHIHMTPDDAVLYEVKDGEIVKVQIEGEKGGILDHVVVRAGENYRLEMHIDTDDANAFLIKNGDWLKLIKNEKLMEA